MKNMDGCGSTSLTIRHCWFGVAGVARRCSTRNGAAARARSLAASQTSWPVLGEKRQRWWRSIGVRTGKVWTESPARASCRSVIAVPVPLLTRSLSAVSVHSW